MDHSLITKYFPHLSSQQQQQFADLGPSLQEWNRRINVISRKDIDQLYLRHVLHSLAIAKFATFPAGSFVLDVGTGGGFPGIPLAIFFPNTQFFLCDSISKKILVVKEIIGALGLPNVSAAQIRAEEIKQRFDYVVSRAVAPLHELIPWVWHKTNNSILCLKGGDLEKEMQECIRNVKIPKQQIKEISISQWFEEPFFEEKKIVSIQI